jgi:hypothetical protein
VSILSLYQVHIPCGFVSRCEVKALMAAVELQRQIDKPTLAVVATLRSKDGEEMIEEDILTVFKYQATEYSCSRR